MAQNVKKFCLYNGETLAVIPLEAEATPEELKNLSLRPKSAPYKNIIPAYVSPKSIVVTSLVSVGSILYSIGGADLNDQMEFQPINKVTKFDPAQPEIKLKLCCNMIQPRRCPAIISIDGIIYAFGGLATDKENCLECPWAEFLDTNKPIKEQKWKALKEPVLRLSLSLQPCAIRYDAENILISGNPDINAGAILYNVANESSKVYSCVPMPWVHAVDPVTLLGEKTIYWISGEYLRAYELDTQIYYAADMNNSRFTNFKIPLWTTLRGPILVHLKDNLFNIFSVFSYPKISGIVQCAKFRVTKGNNKIQFSPRSGERVLHLDLVGYQYYRCDLLWNVWGSVPM